MVWGTEKRAGFILAALLSDDRALIAAGPALPPLVADSLRSQLATGQLSSRDGKARTIGQWLLLLRPELNEASLDLPARMRSLLARGARSPLRAQLLAFAQPTRPDFSLEASLADAMLRISRHAASKERL